MSLVSGIRALGGILATMFRGKRDFYEVFGYKHNPTFLDCMTKYTRQDIAGRIIDAPAQALWTNPPQITSNDAKWDQTWKDFTIQLRLWERLERVDKLAGLGKYSVLLIGFNDGKDLEEPVDAAKVRSQALKILYLQPYSCDSAEIVEFESNKASEHYMRPKYYMINPKNDIQPLSQPSKQGSMPAAGLSRFKVHHSRILHVCENALENDVFGSPRMERVYNLLDDLLKVTGGTSETFWLAGNRGMQVDIDKDLELDPNDEAALAREIDEYQHNLRRVLRTRGVKVNPLGSDNPDPTGTFNVLIQMLSGSTGIPRRVLTGSEAGQLASDQDRANWADRIEERRTDFGMPVIIFPLINKFTTGGALEIKDPKSFTLTVVWPSAFKLSPLENAQTSAQHARSATNFAKAIETMANLNKSTPATEPITTATGQTIPGTPEIPGANLGDLITVDEARKFIGLDKPQVSMDGASDINDPSTSQG